MTFQPQLLREGINQIHVDLHGLGDRQITEEGGVHEALNGLVGRIRVPEIAEQQVPVGALQGPQQLLALRLGQVAQKQRGIPLVEHPQIAEPILDPTRQPPAGGWSRGGGRRSRGGGGSIGEATPQEARDGRIDAVAELLQLVLGQVHLRLVVVGAAVDLADHHRRQQQALLHQPAIGLGGEDPLLEQHHIEALAAPLQLPHRIGHRPQILQAIAAAAQPLVAGLLEAAIGEEGGDGECRLGHGAELGPGALPTVLTMGRLKGEDRCLSFDCRAAGRMTPRKPGRFPG